MKTILFILVSFTALTTTLAGLVLLNNPDGTNLNLPPGLLNETPFKNYLLPGLLLTVLVGGINLVAVYFNMNRHPDRYNWAIAGGFILCIWIVGHLVILQTVNWLHFIYLGVGLLIILIAYQLKGKWAI